ncbi:ABC transporter permease [Paenibacillus dendritiformis]|uniref:ABC transporter permease n=1 Tax=Paenibacillus dendritiformis TaxID=130049 RepID=UPI0010597576|nr:ABC transporter permease [Paenibacillus dendritiformis]TDL58341.1 ABC transporter permease [Paenibacillus dendritiformis]
MVDLAIANIRQGKSAAISLFVLIFAAALLLNIGMAITSAMNTFYEDKVEELHDAHVSMAMSTADFQQPHADFLKTYPGVKETGTEQMIFLPAATIRYNNNEFSIRLALLNADAGRAVAPLKLVAEPASGMEDGMYIPYGLKAGGYQLGDSIAFTYHNKTYRYRVAGFFESALMGTTKLAMLKFYLPDTAYRQLSAELGPAADGVLLSALVTNSEQSGALLRDFHKQFPQLYTSADSSFWSANLDMAASSMMTVHVVALILIAFAAVIVLASLLVIKFHITNSIEEGMVNIGVLKALGYTNRQIVSSIGLQYMLIAIPASAAGAAVSYAAMSAFGAVLSFLTGLLWPGGIHTGTDLLTVLIMILLVLAVTLLSSLRIYKLHPAAALRGGIQTHNFRRNPLPLDKAKGGLSLLLACKAMLTNRRQNLMIAGITAAITFASVFSVVLYYNAAEDKTAFFQLVGAETPDIGIQVAPGHDSGQLLMRMEQMPGVEKANILDYITTAIEGQLVTTEFSDDFGKLDNPTIYEGRYPQYDNEIAITRGLAGQLGTTVGDTVRVGLGEASYPFLITGLNQSLHRGNNGASLTLAGVQHLLPGHQGMSINVYLQGAVNADFIREAELAYGSRIQAITDVNQSLESQSEGYITAIFTVMIVIVAITALVVVLLLYLVINASLIKRKREFGILKAIGYTTFQLMTQIAFGLMPIVIAGIIAGGVLGCLYTNSVLKLILFDAGLSNARFIIPVPLIMKLCMAMTVLAYIVSMLVSRRIKRITAYGLIME